MHLYVLYEAAARRAVYDLMPLPDVSHIQHPLITIITLISNCKLNNNDRRYDIKTSYNWLRNRIVVLPCLSCHRILLLLIQCAIYTGKTRRLHIVIGLIKQTILLLQFSHLTL